MRHRLYPGQDHPDVASSLNNMGFMLESLGDAKAAKPYYQQALEMILRLYPGQDHPHVAYYLNNMGGTLKSLGDDRAAKSYYQQSLEMNRRLYPGQDHPDTAISLNNLGILLTKSKQCVEAQALLNEALCMYQCLEIELITQQNIREALKLIKKNIKRQQKPGSKKGRFCKDVYDSHQRRVTN